MAIEFYRDGPWELPEGWAWARLRDMCKEPGRIDPARQLQGEFGYIDLSAIENGNVAHAQNLLVSKAPSRARQLVHAGDTLLSCVRVYLRNNAIVPDGLDGAVASTAFCVLRPTVAIDPHYLFWFVHSRKFTDILIPLQRGNSPPAVLDDDVRNQLVPIAPIAEQRRIVARIDELFTEIADGETSLARARDDLDTWRRALLKAAVTGELTRDWRDFHKPGQSGEALLNNIRVSKSPKNKTAQRNQELASIDLPEIPDTWAWGTIGDVITSMEYGTSEKCRADAGGLPVLRMGNIQDGEIIFESLKYLTQPLASDAPLLDAGDILFNRTNSEELVGKSAVVNDLERPTSFASYLIRLKTEPDFDPSFIVAWLNSAYGRRWIRANKSQQVGQANLSGGKLRSMPIPVPHPVEQSEIRRRSLAGC
jgi:type I restriction enzyme S subunit